MTLRVLVFGGRDFDDWRAVDGALSHIHGAFGISCVIQGEAKGADFLGRVWAKYAGIPFECFPADWKTHGRAAGSIRNQQMLDEGRLDYAVGFTGGTGTRDMARRLLNAGVPLWQPLG